MGRTLCLRGDTLLTMTETEKLLSYVKTRADLKYGGKYRIICVDGLWMGGFGEVSLLSLSDKTICNSFESVLNDMLQNEPA